MWVVVLMLVQRRQRLRPHSLLVQRPVIGRSRPGEPDAVQPRRAPHLVVVTDSLDHVPQVVPLHAERRSCLRKVEHLRAVRALHVHRHAALPAREPIEDHRTRVEDVRVLPRDAAQRGPLHALDHRRSVRGPQRVRLLHHAAQHLLAQDVRQHDQALLVRRVARRPKLVPHPVRVRRVHRDHVSAAADERGLSHLG